jgi:DNA-binding transcriptional MerR regulator
MLTIAGLERESRVPRSTIYFYIREGVLPAPSRTAQGRFLFTDDSAC